MRVRANWGALCCFPGITAPRLSSLLLWLRLPYCSEDGTEDGEPDVSVVFGVALAVWDLHVAYLATEAPTHVPWPYTELQIDDVCTKRIHGRTPVAHHVFITQAAPVFLRCPPCGWVYYRDCTGIRLTFLVDLNSSARCASAFALARSIQSMNGKWLCWIFIWCKWMHFPLACLCDI